MREKIYVKFQESESSGYLSIEEMFYPKDVKDKYEYHKDVLKRINLKKADTLEGFKLNYVLIDVEYDGRKSYISPEDVFKTLENKGMVVKVGSSMFGGYYLPTKMMKKVFKDQLNKRKDLINKGEYVLIE